MKRALVVAALFAAGCGDDSGLVQKHEDCSTPGDEDGNGLADCDDPACLEAPECTHGSQCGDGLTEGSEQCDDGNTADGDGCDHNCTFTACGNGIMTAGEACDDGNTVDGDGCDSNCKPTGCGNGERDQSEQCDDGNTVDGDGCEADCTLPACGNGIVDAGEQCDDGNTTGGDGCSAICMRDTALVTEGEPNEDGHPDPGGDAYIGNDFDATAMTNADANNAYDASHDWLVTAAIDPSGDEDVFAITNTTTGTVVLDVDVWDTAAGPGLECGFRDDTAMVLRDSTGLILVENDDRNSDFDQCSAVRGTVLAPGAKVYAQILAFGDVETLDYALGIAFHRESCGDGYTTPDEQCDDGNATSGDGCSATCTIEGATAEAEPDDTIPTSVPLTLPAIATGTVMDGDADLYGFTLAAPATVALATFTGEWVCSAPVSLSLMGSSGTYYPLHPVGTCAHLTLPLPAGTYYAVVTGLNGAYLLSATTLDDGGAETEPNDAYTSADQAANGDPTVVVEGAVSATDSDFYAITVPAGAAVRAEAIEGTSGTFGDCDMGLLATTIALFGPAGQNLVSTGAPGRGNCPVIDGLGDAPPDVWAQNRTNVEQTWYVEVQATSATDYRLAITVR